MRFISWSPPPPNLRKLEETIQDSVSRIENIGRLEDASHSAWAKPSPCWQPVSNARALFVGLRRVRALSVVRIPSMMKAMSEEGCMSRQRKQRDSFVQSLFPFLAVLLSTMGALVLLLMLIVNQAQANAKQMALEKREQPKLPKANSKFCVTLSKNNLASGDLISSANALHFNTSKSISKS